MRLTEVFQEQYFRSKSWCSNMIARKNGEVLQYREIGKTGWNKLDITVSVLTREDFYAVSFLQKPEEETGISLNDILKIDKIETKLFRANIWVDGVVLKIAEGIFYISDVEGNNWQRYSLTVPDVLATSYVVYDLNHVPAQNDKK